MTKLAEKLYKIQGGKLIEVEIPLPQEPIRKKAYSVEEARKEIGLGRNKFIELLQTGKIRGIKAGSKWIIPANAIDDFLNGQGA